MAEQLLGSVISSGVAEAMSRPVSFDTFLARCAVAVAPATALLAITLWLGGAAGAARAPQPTFERLFPLAPAEGVFAYARISPDGRTLAYASEAADRAVRGG